MACVAAVRDAPAGPALAGILRGRSPAGKLGQDRSGHRALMKVLFIARAYPPVTGGIENHNWALSQWLPQTLEVRTLANRHGKRALPWFLPWALLYASWQARRMDAVLLGDGVLAIVGWWLKLLRPRLRVVCVVHGLDLTWRAGWYQRLWVGRFLRALDGIIAVSHATRTVALTKGLCAERVIVIPNGLDPRAFIGQSDRAALARLLGRPLEGVQTLLTTGRLVRRKGAAWFIREVMPRLPARVLYLLAGAGPDEAEIRAAIDQHGLGARVVLLGQVDDATRDLLLHTADVFIQPNIPVAGDMEGFGIAVLEAGICGRPVLAAALEGLLDAIVHDANGRLLPAQDAGVWAQEVTRLLLDPAAARALGARAALHVREHHAWASIAARYAAFLGAPAAAVTAPQSPDLA